MLLISIESLSIFSLLKFFIVILFLDFALFKVTLLGATYLAILASLPMIVTSIFGITSTSVTIGGTSLMIVVGVAIETAKQIKTQNEPQEYKGLL